MMLQYRILNVNMTGSRSATRYASNNTNGAVHAIVWQEMNLHIMPTARVTPSPTMKVLVQMMQTAGQLAVVNERLQIM